MKRNNFNVLNASRMCLYMMIFAHHSESTGNSEHENTHPPHPTTDPGRSDTDPNRYSDPIEPPVNPTDDEIQEPDISEMPQREPLDPDEKNPMTETDYVDKDNHTQENKDDYDENEGITE